MVRFKWCFNVQVFDRFQAKWERNWIRGSEAEAVCDYVPTKNVGASFCSIEIKKHTVKG